MIIKVAQGIAPIIELVILFLDITDFWILVLISLEVQPKLLYSIDLLQYEVLVGIISIAIQIIL